jgi:hypothetical protein
MKRKLAVVALSLGLLGGTAGVALADPAGAGPNDHANCNAILGYLNTHHPELIGGYDRADIAHLFKSSDRFGVTPGEIYATFVHAHLGDGVCD